MKAIQFKRIAGVLALVIVTIAASSCNRGYGCPNNFSLDISWEKALSWASAMLSYLL